MADDSNNGNRDPRLAKQREAIDKVINWLREEELNPENSTHREVL